MNNDIIQNGKARKFKGGNKMKKFAMLLIGIGMISNIAFAEPIVYEKPDVQIIVEGDKLELEQEVPIIINSRTLVPLRKLLVGLGVPDNTENIQWIGDTREVKVVYNGVTIDLAIDSTKAYINGKEYSLDSAPVIHRSRTYLPARFVGEALGYTISWDQYTPAVLVTSSKNMDKLTEILNDLNTAINNVTTYEAVAVRKSNVVSNYNGIKEDHDYTVTTIEKANLSKKIVYTESSYRDDNEQNINLSYSTPKALYNCYKYVENDTLYNTGWEVYDYDAKFDDETPFEEKEKIALVSVDNSLYGALLCSEYNNAYVISTISNQIDVLKALDGLNLYNEIIAHDKIENFDFVLALDKETKLPMSLDVKFCVKSEEQSEDGYYLTQEDNEYIVEFSQYNGKVNLDLPKV